MDRITEDELYDLYKKVRDSETNKSDEIIHDFFKNKMNGSRNYARSSYRYDYDYTSEQDIIGKLQDIEKKLHDINEEKQDLLNDGFSEESDEVKELIEEYEKLITSQRNLRIELNKRGKFAAYNDHISRQADAYDYKIRHIVGSLRDMYDSINNLVEPWAKADKAASDYAKTIATSKAGREALRAQTISNVHGNKIAAKLDLSSEEIIEAQLDYSKGIGRNAKITDEGQATLGAMTKVYGGAAKELSVLFEKFGVGPVDTGKHLGKIFAEASKSGLSLEKYADNVNKGLRLAQRYTFSDGLKGMEAMAKRATELHMDMQQIETLANKVGTIEGSITTAAKIQVLGGPFASMADPMGMFSEAWGNIDGLEKRLEKFTENMGHFNRQTGEVEISAFNKQRLRAFAEATGQDYGQIIEQTQQQAKLGEVNSQIARSANASQWDDKTKELFRNTATFENGKAGVSINGDFKTIDEISSKELEQLRQETQSESEDIKEIASMLRDYFQVESSRKKAQDAQRASWIEKLGIGNGIKGLNSRIARSNFLLAVLNGLLLAQGGLRAIGGAGRFFGRNGIGGSVSRVVKRIIGVGSGGKVANTVAGATSAGNVISKAPNVTRSTSMKTVQKIGDFGANLSAKGGKVGKLGEKIFNISVKREGKIAERQIARDAAKHAATKATAQSATQAATTTASQTANGAAKETLKRKLAKSGLGKTFRRINVSRNAATKSLNKAAENVLGKSAGATLTKMGPKIAKAGGILSIAGVAGEIATNSLVSSGKIKKGGASHSAMHIGSKMAQYAGMGAMLGGVGAVAGAALGAVVGSAQMSKIRREMALDNKLNENGIERKGDYGASSLKKIDKALSSGKISNRVRRKMEKEGDMSLLNEIDKVGINKKKEKEEKKEKRRKNTIEFISAIKPSGGLGDKLRSAQFEVQVANFNGKAFDKQAKQSATAMSDVKRHKVVNTLFGASPISKSIKYSPIGLLHNRLVKKKEQNLGNTTYVSALDRLKQRGLGELGGLSIGFGKNLLPTLVKPFNDRPLNQVSIKGGKLEDGNSTSLQELKKIESKDKIQSQSRFKVEPIEININGTLKLESNNSNQSVDIMSELANNRELKKKIAEIVATELNNYKFAGNKVTRSFGINV